MKIGRRSSVAVFVKRIPQELFSFDEMCNYYYQLDIPIHTITDYLGKDMIARFSPEEFANMREAVTTSLHSPMLFGV